MIRRLVIAFVGAAISTACVAQEIKASSVRRAERPIGCVMQILAGADPCSPPGWRLRLWRARP